MKNYAQEIKIFKALSHPVRIAILEILREGEQCVCHLEAALELRQAYISQQLMALRKAGILESRRDGWNIFYRAVSPEIYTVLDAVYQMTGLSPAERIHVPAACTCPRCTAEKEKALTLPDEIQP